jgi:hypothetical protein
MEDTTSASPRIVQRRPAGRPNAAPAAVDPRMLEMVRSLRRAAWLSYALPALTFFLTLFNARKAERSSLRSAFGS